ncbi:glycosyltransferase family 2 protein [Microbacterium thalli]|uniref:Glycosyltransferase family 2 protein n=1 Tax=Microbacterium thalli TaxID=3027921 RepID=A0ABT5SJG9_9MICO|nr:glycosyltransferase family 2 protein [Microbacterium thalli]MDD7962965.1 glycosyltransferase family 2 protein [Microbacterium thalli]MDN8548542.1 glycosyltransferase family 2 protein [Microbacterium thalli]
MSTPVVTVIIPGRDVAPYAEEALDSLRTQTLTSWRGILVDDGSRDATGSMFRAAAAADPRLNVVSHDRPRGLGAARNAGLDLVETPFVAFLDADDILAPRALERLVGTLDASGSDFVAGAYVRLRPTDEGYTPGPVQPWVAAATDPERRGVTLADHPAASGNIVAWSKASRIEFWRRNRLRFPEGRLYEDQLVAQQMYTRARAFDVIPDVVVQWRERADGSSITQHRAQLPVLVDYLDGLRGGLAVLDAADARAAARARVDLVLDLDVPPLVRIAQTHPDPDYRRRVGALVREFLARTPGHESRESETAELLRAAHLW